ncbi:transposase [Streptomyces sp. WAC01490]|uniref:transposase n=1 Tax=unclassified Streptomyces TaxID=2593676 RepID=UPI003F32D361
MTDEAWRRIEPLMGGSRSAIDRRILVEALLDKAVSGERFKDLAQRYGLSGEALQSQSHRPLKAGVWATAMTSLEGMEAVPAWQPPRVEMRASLKSLAIESIVGAAEHDRWTSGRRRRTPYAPRNPAAPRRASRSARWPRSP